MLDNKQLYADIGMNHEKNFSLEIPHRFQQNNMKSDQWCPLMGGLPIPALTQRSRKPVNQLVDLVLDGVMEE